MQLNNPDDQKYTGMWGTQDGRYDVIIRYITEGTFSTGNKSYFCM